MLPERAEDVLENAVATLSTAGDGSSTKAASEGLPDREGVARLVERTRI